MKITYYFIKYIWFGFGEKLFTKKKRRKKKITVCDITRNMVLQNTID